ncbi:acyltransferase family protein [Streptomyces sp. NPDC050560]|uniref:acyltransferase family protein n=1 Tax=Streptomyces sp. NPDC050560 TaxID=3365630 RepID=UPI00379B7CFC
MEQQTVPREAAPSVARQPASPGRGLGRDAFFDNAKYLTILLVGCGHAWEPLTYDSRAVRALYLLVYAFHMPAFALVSGYFSRTFDASPGRVRRLVTGVAVPYAVFEIAYTLFYRWAGHDPDYPFSLLDPWYLMWFLLALFVWRLTTPLWLALRHPVPVALGVAALASMSPATGGDLGLQRVLGFLPCFVLGLVLRPEHFARLRTRAVRGAALVVFPLALAGTYLLSPRLDTEWLYHRSPVTDIGVPGWAGLLSTPVLFGLAVLLTGCFLAWVPGRRLWCTALGAGTVYAYLLHGFVIKASRYWGWYDHGWVHGPLGELAVTAAVLTLMTALCTVPVRRLLRVVVEPPLTRVFRSVPRRT